MSRLDDALSSCPAGILPGGPDATANASTAAQTYLHAIGGWRTSSVRAVYPVGTHAGTYSAVFNENIPRTCGTTAARNVYVVELVDTSGPWRGTDTHAEVTVSRFDSGWRVWGRY